MKTYAPPKLRQIVTEAVFRRRRIFLFTVYVIVGLALSVSLLMQRKYQADAKLMVQNVRSASQLSTSPSDKLVQQGDCFDNRNQLRGGPAAVAGNAAARAGRTESAGHDFAAGTAGGRGAATPADGRPGPSIQQY